MGTTTLLTFREFEELPDSPEDIELIEGELVTMPPPEADHMKIATRLYKLLDGAVAAWRRRTPGEPIGEVYIEMGYRLGTGSWLQPDVSLTHPAQPCGKYFEGAPLIAFEVVSDSDRAPDLIRKIRLYLAHGSQEVWLIYPEVREVHVYRNAEPQVMRKEHAIASELLPGIEIPFERFLG